MTKEERKQIIRRIRDMYDRGVAKADIYKEVSPTVDKPVFVARVIAALPNSLSKNRYRFSNGFLAAVVFIIALLAGFGKFGQVAPYNVYAAVVMGLVFFALFAVGAWGIWRRYPYSYRFLIVIIFMMILQSLRVILHDFATDPDLLSYNDKAMLGFATTIEIPFLLFLLWFAVRMRNNIFSKTGFFGGPKKDKQGNYRFESAWELKAMKKAAKLKAKELAGTRI